MPLMDDNAVYRPEPKFSAGGSVQAGGAIDAFPRSASTVEMTFETLEPLISGLPEFVPKTVYATANGRAAPRMRRQSEPVKSNEKCKPQEKQSAEPNCQAAGGPDPLQRPRRNRLKQQTRRD
jgi:hypothetical protein